MRVDDVLMEARRRIDPLDARVLLQFASGLDHASLIAHPERVLEAAVLQRFWQAVARRAAGEPVAYLTGTREFYGREFRVSPAVLIPRPDTELLVEVALEQLAPCSAPRVLDLGTGSGIIAITLALEKPGARVWAGDLSDQALAVATDNARRLGALVSFVQGSWYGPWAGRSFDLIVSNPPYIAGLDGHLERGDLRFEPRAALTDASADGLASLHTLIDGAARHLEPGGAIWLEHGFDQGPACRARLLAAGFVSVSTRRDLAGNERVSGGLWPENAQA